MSWYINEIGTRAAVRAKVEASTQVPPAIKTVILDIIDDPNPTAPNGVHVEGNGHQGGGSFNNLNQLKVWNVNLTL